MLSIAVIGAGRIGHVHAKTIAAHPQAELALVCDPFEDAAEKLAATYGARSCKDAEEVFADPEIDAVIVGSPTPLHIPHLLAAAKAGKAVLCEKPIALDMKDVEAAQAELDAVTVPVMFGFNRRFDPSFAAARAAVEAGKIGDIEQLTIISRDPAAPPAEYIKVSGGIFRDMTIHDFDTARFFLGEIEEVYAAGQNLDPALKDTGDFDAAVVTLKAASGAVATIINNRHCSSGYDQRLEASGREGALFAENIRATTVRLSNGEVTDAQEPYLDFFLERYADAYRIELSAFIEAVEAGTTPPTGIEDAIAALRLAEAATESAHSGLGVLLSCAPPLCGGGGVGLHFRLPSAHPRSQRLVAASARPRARSVLLVEAVGEGVGLPHLEGDEVLPAVEGVGRAGHGLNGHAGPGELVGGVGLHPGDV